MRGMNMLQLVGGVAVAGAVAAGSTALTGTGLTNSQTTQFVGGSVTQTVTGATLNSITYGYVANTGNTQVNSMTISLTGASGHHFAMATTNGASTDTGYGGAATLWSCTDGSTTGLSTASPVIATLASNSVTCQPAKSDGTVQDYYLGLASVTVTIS